LKNCVLYNPNERKTKLLNNIPVKKLFLAFNISVCLFISMQMQSQYTKLLDFNGRVNGGDPYSAPTISGTVLYGMTQHGGTSDMGCIYKINTDGTGPTKLFSFSGTNGRSPNGSLVLSGTVLYGGTHYGGLADKGCIFKINTNGTGFDTLMCFNGTGNGSQSHGLIISDTVIYGETHFGGLTNNGTIFKISTNGYGYTKLHEFNGSDGTNAGNTLTLSGSELYGVTYNGGKNLAGTIFKINTDGSGFTTLYDFNDADGKNPWGYLTLSGSVLYGATWGGGVTGNGVIYKINTDGSGFTKLFDFNGANGDQPWSVSLSTSGNVLYGTTTLGGVDSLGCIYKINTNGGGYCKILDFHGTDNGSIPQSELLLSGNTLYGTTSKGGSLGVGVIFKYDIPSSFPCDTAYYTLTVNNGTGSGSYTSGTIVNISADTPTVGKIFDKWIGDITGIADVNASVTTFTTNTTNASITASYIDIYTLTVNSGIGSGFYTPGTVVNITADAPVTGKVFSKWTGDVTGIANVNAPVTTFTMPDTNASITATYDTIVVIISAFSPNGDGVNDYWYIDEMNEAGFIGDVQVFNRWGQLVYDYSKTHKPWYGYDLSGSKLPIESYHYYIDYKNGKKPKRGIVTIVR
jgi:gliding motility-associated-like protein